MQVPLIDRLNDLQVGFTSLQNPSSSFPSPITTGIQSVSVVYNFCKWGAVFLAFIATFTSIINRVTVILIRFRSKAPSLPSISFYDDDDLDFTTDEDEDDDDDNDNVINDYSSSSEDDDEPSSSSSFLRLDDFFRLRGTTAQRQNDDSQSQNGSYNRSCSFGDIFSLAELANGQSVVKLWDSIGFGLGLDFDDYEESSCSSSSSCSFHAPASSPAVVLSAGGGSSRNVEVEIWDTRLRRRKPSVVAEWGPAVGKTVRVESGGVSKVYVRDDGRYGVTVGDMRKVSTPLGNVTESDADNSNQCCCTYQT